MNKEKNEEDTKVITTDVVTPEFSILRGWEARPGEALQVGVTLRQRRAPHRHL